MLAAIMAFLGIIPGVGKVIEGITGAMFDAKVKMLVARTNMTRDVAVETIKAAAVDRQAHAAEMAAVAGSTVLSLLIVAFAAPVVIFEFKVVVWDNVLGLGSTPEIHGSVATWMNTIINWVFGSSTALAAGSMALKVVQGTK